MHKSRLTHTSFVGARSQMLIYFRVNSALLAASTSLGQLMHKFMIWVSDKDTQNG
jgi:hypothetical protein